MDQHNVPTRRTGLKRGIFLIPSLFTSGTLFLGFYAIIQSMHHNFANAGWAIVIAGFCDMFDGRIARLAKAESKFGVEYDSLADLVAFGLAPAVLLYSWSLASFSRIGWVATFIYLACGTLRLARFNVQQATVERKFFQGLPIPMAAAPIACTILFYHQRHGDTFPLRNWWLLAMPVLIGILMISTVQFRSFKQINLRSRHSFFWLVGLTAFAVVMALEPVLTLFTSAWTYAASGIIEEIVTGKQRKLVVAKMRERRALSKNDHGKHRDRLHVLRGHHEEKQS